MLMIDVFLLLIISQLDIAQIICLGLVALQHRGQESAGIVTSEGKSTKNFSVCKGMGMINNIFNDDAIRKLRGNLGIGHTRYSTSASSEEVNCQPFVVHTAHGAMAVAHNGELVNCESVRRNVSNLFGTLSCHSECFKLQYLTDYHSRCWKEELDYRHTAILN